MHPWDPSHRVRRMMDFVDSWLHGWSILWERHPLWLAVPVGAVLGAVGVRVAYRFGFRFTPQAGDLVDVSRQHQFTVLLEAARADTGFRGEVLVLLDLPGHQRRRVVTKTVEQMKRDEAPPDLVQAFALLNDDNVVERARKLLDE